MFIVLGEILPQLPECVLHAGQGRVDGDLLVEGDGFKREVRFCPQKVYLPLFLRKSVDGLSDAFGQFPVARTPVGTWVTGGDKLFQSAGAV